MNNFKKFWKGGQKFHFKAKVTFVGGGVKELDFMIISPNLESAEFEARESLHRDFRYYDIERIELYII